MRLLQVVIPAGQRVAVLKTLDDEEIDYAVADETGDRGYEAIVTFPIPGAAVENVLDRLESVGIDEDTHVVVTDAEAVISKGYEQLEERYETKDIEEDRISRQELISEASELTPVRSVYITMTTISSIVATAGLLLDSPAVVVGSMVIAPLIGPALAASVGTVIDDEELRWVGFSYQFGGLAIAILGATVFAVVARTLGFAPPAFELIAASELEERLAPNLLSLVVALGAGVAGVLSLSTRISAALVGVMIAAALIPPAAAVGIAIAWGVEGAAIGATVLVLVNLLSVNLAGITTLWVSGYRPSGWAELSNARRKTVRSITAVGLVVLVLSIPLTAVTITEYQTAQLEERATEEVTAVLDDLQYDELRAESVEVHLDDDYPFRSIDRVTVTVISPDPGAAEGLADRLYERISTHTNDDLTVEVRYIVVEERTGGPAQAIAYSVSADGT